MTRNQCVIESISHIYKVDIFLINAVCINKYYKMAE